MAYVDGGKRGNGDTSAAYAIFAIRAGYMRLIAKGAAFNVGDDSFQAECMSMKMATEALRRIGPPLC